MKQYVLTLFLVFGLHSLHAQIKDKVIRIKEAGASEKHSSNTSNRPFIPCAFTEYQDYLREQNALKEPEAQFEIWLRDKIEQQKTVKNTNSIITIPVVFHIVHNGDPLGSDENIPDEQVFSQLQVLNEDFRKLLGSPGYNTNPVGADTEIEFCLAQRDPQGDATTGIERVEAGLESFTNFATTEELKKLTIWDPYQYLNIWVVKMDGDIQSLGGYAFFPEGASVAGLEGNTSTDLNDGVVLNYKIVGSVATFPEGDYYPVFDMGDVATHEVGHFFGLRHISGDSNGTCDHTDYCDDTPTTAQLNTSCEPVDTCPDHPGMDMIENYMNYTPDACKSVFTNDQKARMHAVLQSAPRRMALVNSNACVYPLDLDGALEIELNLNCETAFSPGLLLTNKGSVTITTAQVSYRIDDGPVQEVTWNGALATQESTTISLPALEAANGTHTFYAGLETINSAEDQYDGNSSKIVDFIKNNEGYMTGEVLFTLQPDAFGSETSWTLRNETGAILYAGGPYTDANPGQGDLLVQSWNLEAGCYTFTIEDSYGDGICCSAGEGFYKLETDTGLIIAEGGAFRDSESFKFKINGTMGLEDHKVQGLTLYPNPAAGMLYIKVPDNGILPESFEIYNAMGQKVAERTIQSADDLAIDVDSYSKGLYFIRIESHNRYDTLTFIKD